MRRRLTTIAATVALLGTIAGGASAQEPDAFNFGQCASVVARVVPTGPEHGLVLREASHFNPSGIDFRCPGPNPGNPGL